MKTKTRAAKTKESKQLTLKDRLSRLTYYRACQLLGPDGPQLIRQGAAYDDIDIDRDVYLRGDLFRLKLRGAGAGGKDAVVDHHHHGRGPEPAALQLHRLPDALRARRRGRFAGAGREDGAGAGRRRPTSAGPWKPSASRSCSSRPSRDRQERARTEKFRLRSSDPRRPWTDYTVTSAAVGQDLSRGAAGRGAGRVVLLVPRLPHQHAGHVQAHPARAATACGGVFRPRRGESPIATARPSSTCSTARRSRSTCNCPTGPIAELVKAVGSLADGPIDDVRRLVDCLARLERLGRNVTVYPDAEELIQRRLFERHMADRMAEIRKDPARHPLRKQLLKVELLPYQLEGIAFAAGVGRAILADDMGLGKTIQGVGAAEILAREAGIGRVLVVCPASLKSQWRSEIHRFSDRSVQLVIGGAAERARQYDNDCFFTVCNYEQVLRDILAIERVRWDLIILDEGQRIKNWESKTARVIKGLRSPFALVLSGTPLENRLDELYSVVQFVDDRRLPPGLPLLPSPPRGRREGQGAGLQEPGPVAGEPAADPAAAARASRCSSSCRRGPARSSASRPPTSSSSCTAPTCASCR